MVTEKAKNTEKVSDGTDESRIHDQVIDAIKKSQEATLKVVSAWSESVAKIAPKLPDMPKLPLVDSLPKPAEISDKFFKFAQELMATEHEFVKRLLEALPGHEAPKDAPKE
jgi:3-methyladenine DNA glycosylase AlkC